MCVVHKYIYHFSKKDSVILSCAFVSECSRKAAFIDCEHVDVLSVSSVTNDVTWRCAGTCRRTYLQIVRGGLVEV